ncbi:cell wall metabolism sensor histidine kinase WalK [Mycobacterium sp. 1274761.0]|uniref:sensor histidine kinase n=1 Tax=Mycobacterium sp. 1274761.0 TaxID=1834077 RepID=UPI0009EF348C|nr:HAMP domain-containing sensor histidine kinase [Mycobacterium sp. 1274761.0]
MFGVSALVSIVVLIVGGLAISTLRDYVTAMSDSQVMHSLAAFKHTYGVEHVATKDGNERLTAYTGQAAGNLIAVKIGDRVVQSAMFDDDGPHRAPEEAVTALESLHQIGTQPTTVVLGDMGAYRIAGVDGGNGERLISAVSLRSAHEVIATKVKLVAAITIIAAVLAAAGTVLLVRQALRPLRRVAATAASAADIPLAGDDHRITSWVRRSDSNPDHEVGIVGETLNRLLANVDSALAARAESDRRMRRFLTDASHELRTPLAAIHGYAELTRQDSASLPATTEYALARIESESRRMAALVDDMLLLAHLDEGRALEIERMDFVEVVADAVNDVAVTAPNHRYVTELPDEPMWLDGDRSHLHQVVTNLLVNARNHTPPGVTVTTTLRRVPDALADTAELVVVDDGPGIESRLLPDLFGRFVRADKSRSRDMNSTGLGLAIVKSIVEAHGGVVGVESRPGHTEFRVRLAMARARTSVGVV